MCTINRRLSQGVHTALLVLVRAQFYFLQRAGIQPVTLCTPPDGCASLCLSNNIYASKMDVGVFYMANVTPAFWAPSCTDDFLAGGTCILTPMSQQWLP